MWGFFKKTVGFTDDPAVTGVDNSNTAISYLKGVFNHLLNNVSAARMTNLDSRVNAINNNTATNNTASATGILSQKLSQINNTVNTINTTANTINANASTAATRSMRTMRMTGTATSTASVDTTILTINGRGAIHAVNVIANSSSNPTTSFVIDNTTTLSAALVGSIISNGRNVVVYASGGASSLPNAAANELIVMNTQTAPSSVLLNIHFRSSCVIRVRGNSSYTVSAIYSLY